jgi:NitT/TauT family transport system substrate-binding protein
MIMTGLRVWAVAIAAIGCVFEMGDAARAADPFTLMFGQQTATTSEARSYFIPKSLGFFKEEGLDVTLQPTDGATQEMQILAAGKGDAGMGAPPAILLARNAGAKVRAIFMTGREHGTSLAVLADGPIKDPKDLKGKKIGVMSMGASRTLDGYAMAQAAGLDPKTDVQWLPVGFGVQAGLALQRGDVQALALWDITYADMEANGIKMRYFTFPFQKDIFGYVYATTDEKLATRRADIIKVLRSGAKAEIFERASVEAAACVYLVESGRWASTADKAKDYQKTVDVMRQDFRTPVMPDGQIGTFPANGWATVRDYYYNLGIIKEKLPAEDYYVTDASLYAEANAFDRSKIEALAHDYHNICKDAN